MLARSFLFPFFLLAGVCLTQAQPANDLKEFVKLLPGFYSTEAMWKKDSTFSHVQLRIVPIWKEDPDGYWFYLEQAEVKNLARPYRQVVLHLTSDGNKIVSSNLPIKNRLSFAGAWKDEVLLKKLTKADLDFTDACNIYFKKTSKKKFEGGTRPGGCPNQYRGAAYFTNVSSFTPKSLSSWDRGWKADGQLAWGPAAHGYTFDKISGL
ncbi:MAG: chromophore lyase CpcT/CpeT [Cyclobacteriaceae bacterium]|nr:chromophore lyase CpcT/CpeT [Cyclobacteriaceae bacterium]